MKNLIKLALFFGVVSLNGFAQAAEYEFLNEYNADKNKLKQLPEKPIEKTLYCSQMQLLIDQAPVAELTTEKADRIVVSKSRRKLYLLSHGQLISQYDVAFGFGSLEGPKSQSGDGRTPEGLYEIDLKKKRSNYTKALHVSYPNEQDEKFADKYGVDAGGSIMIHGFPEDEIDGLDPVLIPKIHPNVDWTQGCMAVKNAEIEEIFNFVDEGLVVEICPLEKTAEVAPQL